MKYFFAVIAFNALQLRAVQGATAAVFSKDIAPIFVAKCLVCHNAEKGKGNYRLHTFDALLKPGASKEAPVVPGKPEQSKLFQLITATNEDDRMPQKDEALPPAQILAIKTWIEQGAAFDASNRSVLLAVLSPPRYAAAPRDYAVTVPVTALAFDVPGKQLAASGYHEITVWDSRSGTLGQRLGGVAERIFDLAYSPDGRWLACAAGTPGRIGEVRLFNASNAEVVRVLATIGDAELCLAFSPDGKKLAAGGADNAIRVWDLSTDKPPLVIEQHADWILSLAFDPNGGHLVSGSRDKSARLFDAISGELDETYTGHNDFVTAVAWPDEKSIISASRSRSAHRWNVKDAKKTAEFTGWDGDPTRLVVFETNLFSTSLDGKLRQHDIESRELKHEFDGHHDAIHSLALHAASRRLATGSHDGEVRVWNADDGTLWLKFIAAPGYTSKLSRAQ